MKRVYDSIIQNHFSHYRQMVFLSGPRQVGKTTIAESVEIQPNLRTYLNWDNSDQRGLIEAGPARIMETISSLNTLTGKKPLLIFDEIHKFYDWKNFLKGFYDTYGKDLDIIVTGSSRLDIYKRGGDSMMGRYFLYHVDPLSIGELLRTTFPTKPIQAPQKINPQQFKQLLQFGGFPEPFIQARPAFSTRWQRMRLQQLFREDLRDLTSVRSLSQMETFSRILAENVACIVNYSQLAKLIRINDETVRAWIEILNSFYFCFTIKPWSKNITRSIIKQPKVFLWDWSNITDIGKRHENFIAVHLKKSVQLWTDLGFGEFDLHYLRDKEQREVDFLISRDGLPWFMVEVKTSEKPHLSPSLLHFKKQLDIEHCFQVAIDMPFIEKDCFKVKKPVIVPASTLLSQLL